MTNRINILQIIHNNKNLVLHLLIIPRKQLYPKKQKKTLGQPNSKYVSLLKLRGFAQLLEKIPQRQQVSIIPNVPFYSGQIIIVHQPCNVAPVRR